MSPSHPQHLDILTSSHWTKSLMVVDSSSCWSIIHYVYQSFIMLVDPSSCWSIPHHVSWSLIMLVDPSSCWSIFHHFGRSFIMLVDPSSCWSIPHHVGRSLIMLVDLPSCWSIPHHVGRSSIMLIVFVDPKQTKCQIDCRVCRTMSKWHTHDHGKKIRAHNGCLCSREDVWSWCHSTVAESERRIRMLRKNLNI